ncbi:MAG TPA: SRPBCC family protein [Anaerolineae bacterium]|nr:SRPBCC family protein [Anaerolineae bacterium]
MCERIKRVVIGLIAAALILFVGFALVLQMIPTWGATPEEGAREFPGDELVSNATVNWTHAITIDAPVQQVWGWVAQIGERRGAFYSYTFIENQMGNGDVYHNAERIVPEWQNPKPGDVLISGALPMTVYQVVPNKQLIGYMHGAFDWLWSWNLEAADPTHTRLIVRMRIAMPSSASNPLIDYGIAMGGFVMEQGMLQGIQARAEGNIPPFYSEALQIALWLVALAVGVIAAVFFVMFKEWLLPFTLAVGSVVVLFVFTFWQPQLWVRVMMDIVLMSGLTWFAAQKYLERSARPISRERTSALTLNPTA